MSDDAQPMKRVTPLRSTFEFAGLCALALAQPVLELGVRSPAFFVENQAGGGEAVVFVLALLLLPPLVLVGAERALALISPRIAAGFHVGVVGLLVVLIVLPVADRVGA